MKKSSEDENDDSTKPKAVFAEKEKLSTSFPEATRGRKPKHGNDAVGGISTETRISDNSSNYEQTVEDPHFHSDEEKPEKAIGSKIQRINKKGSESTRQENKDEVSLDNEQSLFQSDVVDLGILSSSVNEEDRDANKSNAEESRSCVRDEATHVPSIARRVNPSTDSEGTITDGGDSYLDPTEIQDIVDVDQPSSSTANANVSHDSVSEPDSSLFHAEDLPDSLPGTSNGKDFRQLYFNPEVKCPICKKLYDNDCRGNEPVKEVLCGHFMCAACLKSEEADDGCLVCKQEVAKEAGKAKEETSNSNCNAETEGQQGTSQSEGQQGPSQSEGQQGPSQSEGQQDPSQSEGQDPSQSKGHQDLSQSERQQDPSQSERQQDPSHSVGQEDSPHTEGQEDPSHSEAAASAEEPMDQD